MQRASNERHPKEIHPRDHTYCKTSLTSRKCASAALVGGASGFSYLIWGSGPSLSQTAKNSRSFLLRDVTIPLRRSAPVDGYGSMRRWKRYPASTKAELTHLSWARLDRKSRERSAGATSPILGESRHPFSAKKTVESILMVFLEMISARKSDERRCGCVVLIDLRFSPSGRPISRYR